ncbi:14_t:CDS:2, partial [Cetraspora pellucida]
KSIRQSDITGLGLSALSCFQILSLTSHFIGRSKSLEVHFSLNNPYIKSEPEGCNNDSDYENHSRSDSQGNNNYSGSKGSCQDFTIQLNWQLIITLICYIFRQLQEQSNSSFVPYDSILKRFQSYRFYPCYKQEIGKHVYKLTIYSHDYNVDCKMCVFESQSRGHYEELISNMSSYYERCTPIEQQEYHSSLEALLNKLRAEGKTNVNKIIDAIKQLGQEIDNEETLSAYNINKDLENDNNNIQTGSEEILKSLYEMQQDTVEDLRHIDIDYFQDQYHILQDEGTIQDKQMYVQQGEETLKSQGTQTNNESSTLYFLLPLALAKNCNLSAFFFFNNLLAYNT